MKLLVKNLTKEQKENGIVFSSCFSNSQTEQKNDEIWETKYYENWRYKANDLMQKVDEKFEYHIVRQ